jgi:imidazolonepropionase-like amidohydrolase
MLRRSLMGIETRGGRCAASALIGIAASVAVAPGTSLAAPVAVVGGTVHPIAAPAIERGVILFEGEKILGVGAEGSISIPPGAALIDASGLHVWPGMIDGHSTLGLREINSVRGTLDVTESGEINPNARAEVAINASSSHIPVTRANGVLLAAVVPSGSMVPGTSAVIALDGWTWEEVVRGAPAGLVIQWPEMGPKVRAAEFAGGEKVSGGKDWEERLARLDEMILEARAYVEGRAARRKPRDQDVRWESLRSVIEGRTPVWIEAATLPQIRSALDWTARHGLEMVLVDGDGGTCGDAWRFAAELAARRIPVVMQTTRMPRREYEPYDTPFAGPAKLHDAGVRVIFGSWGDANARNLPSEAARAVAFGFPREAAERALTLGAAEVFGIADRYGSLETGKSATFILVEGDLLETRMNVQRAFLDGRELDLSSRHTELWKKWSARPMNASPNTGSQTSASPGR